ncbi:AAA family ATPase [Oxalicibacterium faecigallinarum]|nr:AAA family ATPase [Oxalicibacterium faecigallinarum]
MVFRVFFSSSEKFAMKHTAPETVVVWPVDPKWNDFSYAFQAMARFISKEGDSDLQLRMLVVPETLGDNSYRFDLWLETKLGSDSIIDAVPLRDQFFTILKSESAYRELVKWAASVGSSIEEILFPLRDMVYLRLNLLEQEALESLLKTNAISKGVFRREPTFLAWHKAGRLLSNSHEQDIADVRNNFSFSAKLSGFTGPHSIDLNFDAPPPLNDRCHALIGINGVGKSQFLRELIVQLASQIDGTGTDPFTSDGGSRAENCFFSPASFRVNRVLALSWDSKSAFPPEVRLNSKFQYLNFSMHDDIHRLDSGVAPNSSDTLSSQLIQLYRDSAMGIDHGLERLRDTLKPLFDVKDLAVEILPSYDDRNSGGWRSLHDISLLNEERQLEILSRVIPESAPKRWVDNQGPTELSSGERVFLNFGIRCAARVETGTLLVLDEPETHLHPKLIADFMRVLSAMLEKTKSVALIATHSPFVVRELPGSCVHVLKVDEELTPHISSAFLRTFGANVEALATNIFADADSTQVNQEVARKIATLGLSFEEIREKYARDVSPEVLSEIRQILRGNIGA